MGALLVRIIKFESSQINKPTLQMLVLQNRDETNGEWFIDLTICGRSGIHCLELLINYLRTCTCTCSRPTRGHTCVCIHKHTQTPAHTCTHISTHTHTTTHRCACANAREPTSKNTPKMNRRSMDGSIGTRTGKRMRILQSRALKKPQNIDFPSGDSE